VTIMVLYKEPKKICERKIIQNRLTDFRELVEGNFECVRLGRRVVLFCNEEGKLKNLPLNVPLGEDPIHGPLIVCGEKEKDSHFGVAQSLPELSYIYYARIFNATMFDLP